jgi:predicted  nucleic acid-binding Zn-ribbon protein
VPIAYELPQLLNWNWGFTQTRQIMGYQATERAANRIIKNVDEQFDALSKKVSEQFENLSKRAVGLEQQLTDISTRVTAISQQLGEIEKTVAAIREKVA